METPEQMAKDIKGATFRRVILTVEYSSEDELLGISLMIYLQVMNKVEPFGGKSVINEDDLI